MADDPAGRHRRLREGARAGAARGAAGGVRGRPRLRRAARVHPRGARAAARLGLHDTRGRRGVGAAAAAYYNAVWRNLLELLFDDELPVGLKADGGARWRSAGRAAAHQPAQRLVGQQAHPERHRGQGRDPAPGPRRGPPRADPRARQGPRQVAVGQAAPAHPRAPRCSAATRCRAPVRWLVQRRAASRCRAARRSSTPTAGTPATGTGSTGRRRCGWSSTWRDLDASTWINQTGVSGHPTDVRTTTTRSTTGSAGRQRPWPFTEAAVRETDPDVLTLQAGGRRAHGLTPRSVRPSAVTTASTGWSCAARGRAGPRRSEQLLGVQHDDDRGARAPPRQRAVVAAAALAHPRAEPVDGEAGREHEVGQRDGIPPEGRRGGVGRRRASRGRGRRA